MNPDGGDDRVFWIRGALEYPIPPGITPPLLQEEILVESEVCGVEAEVAAIFDLGGRFPVEW